jgi:hypothetical protein
VKRERVVTEKYRTCDICGKMIIPATYPDGSTADMTCKRCKRDVCQIDRIVVLNYRREDGKNVVDSLDGCKACLKIELLPYLGGK